MTDATPAEPRERELWLRYAGDCRHCGTALAAGTRARWDPDTRTIRCLACPTTRSLPCGPPAAPTELGHENHTPNGGVAGASAQHQFEAMDMARQPGRLSTALDLDDSTIARELMVAVHAQGTSLRTRRPDDLKVDRSQRRQPDQDGAALLAGGFALIPMCACSSWSAHRSMTASRLLMTPGHIRLYAAKPRSVSKTGQGSRHLA